MHNIIYTINRVNHVTKDIEKRTLTWGNHDIWKETQSCYKCANVYHRNKVAPISTEGQIIDIIVQYCKKSFFFLEIFTTRKVRTS